MGVEEEACRSAVVCGIWDGKKGRCVFFCDKEKKKESMNVNSDKFVAGLAES